MTRRAASADQLAALQRTLAAEHAAVYGYGLVGGKLIGTEEDRATAAFTTHETRRDSLQRLIVDSGGTPVPALPAYRPKAPVTDRRSALQLAVALEQDCATAYVTVVGATDDPALRRTAASWLADAAVRGQLWRSRLGAAALATNPPLPGLSPVTVTPTPSSG